MRTVPPVLGWVVLASLAASVAVFHFMPRGAPTVEGPPVLRGAWAAYVAPASVCSGGDDAAAVAADQERTMLCLVNYARARRGLAPVAPTQPLAGSSAVKVREIVACRRLAHDPCGRGPRQAAGYVATGENIAYVSANAASPRYVLNGWLNSPRHRENLLRPEWTEQGAALVVGATVDGHRDVNVWVSQFGHR